jgi:hypothetical protein
LHGYPAAIDASGFVGVYGEFGLFALRLGEERAGLGQLILVRRRLGGLQIQVETWRQYLRVELSRRHF